MSVVFDFNASLNAFAPASPISLSVDMMIMEKSDLMIHVFCASSSMFTGKIEFNECCV